MSALVLVALGSNLGERARYLAAARNALSLVRGTRLAAATRVSETAPFGAGPQGAYLNQMVALCTTLPPLALLDELHRIERALGRVRRTRWGARTIDLDVVAWDRRRLRHERLVLPHPGLASRDFWRAEVAELAALGHAVAEAA